jgi:hypothetical protein
LNAYAKARDYFQKCCLNDDNFPSIIADRKQRARGEKCRRYFISMTLDGELTLLKDRQADTGQKEILLEHLEHLVISSLAVVFINLGVQVPRDLLKQFETKKDCTPDIVENRLEHLMYISLSSSMFPMHAVHWMSSLNFLATEMGLNLHMRIMTTCNAHLCIGSTLNSCAISQNLLT